MFDFIKPGGIIGVSGKCAMSRAIQVGTLSLPNIGPLGKWGWSGTSHVGIACPVFGEMLVYESTSFSRSACVRTGREDPVGVQAHHVSDIVEAGGDVRYYPLQRELYDHEVDRLSEFLEECLGHGYDTVGAGKTAGGLVSYFISKMFGKDRPSIMFCSELDVAALRAVGVVQTKNPAAWNPNFLIRFLLKEGIIGKGILLS